MPGLSANSEKNADKLKNLLENLLIPLVEKRHKQIEKYNKFPHIKAKRRDEAVLLA